MAERRVLDPEHRKMLQQSFSGPLPFCRGVLPVTPNDLVLYYGSDENPCRLSLYHPAADALERLAAACEPATFGKNNEDVYDESYRKARKLSADTFMIGLDIVGRGLIKIIRENLLVGLQAEKSVRAELYSLNIYGEGSFFKAHVDTPRSTRMFGSLVIFFPTSYEGGTLLIRKGNEEWPFDAAKALAGCQGPYLAYVALYSDIEHEVSAVTSGHRITVTYNLYFDDDTPTIPLFLSPSALALMNVLEILLLDATFLPHGGCLGFNLEHHYPVETDPTSSYISVSSVDKCLKGVDAELLEIAMKLSLNFCVCALIDTYDGLFACGNSIPHLDNDEDTAEQLRSEGGLLINHYDYRHDGSEDMLVHWVTNPSKLNRHSPIEIYGNEAAGNYSYTSFCILIEVGTPGRRSSHIRQWQQEDSD